MQKGQTTQARSDLEQASHLDPNNAYVWSSLAEVYLRLQEQPKSTTAAQRAEKLGGSDPVVCHLLAMYYSESNHPERAAPLEQKFAASPRADPAALGRAASLFLAGGNRDQAFALATQAVAQQASPFNQQVLGRVLLAQGKEQEALPYLQKAWEANRADDEATFDYVNALLRSQAFTEAADAITLASRQRPSNVQLELLLGVARYGQRRFDDAVVTFLHVIRLDPDVQQPYLFLGRLLEQAGSHLSEIITADTAWAARDTKNPKAQLELAKALLQQDHLHPQADALLRKSIALDANDWESHYQLGLLLEARRDFPAAGEELRKCIALDPKQPMPHYHLARVYDRLGDPVRAGNERTIHSQLTATTKEH